MPHILRHFDRNFKSKVALETIQGLKSISEGAEKFNIHPNQVTMWKKQRIDGTESVFEGSSSGKKKSESEPEAAKL